MTTRLTKHFVYIVECVDGTLYTGYTTRPKARVGAHNRGKGAKYTATRRPVRLVYLEEQKDEGAGLRRELQVKRLDRSGKLLLCLKYAGSKKPSLR